MTVPENTAPEAAETPETEPAADLASAPEAAPAEAATETETAEAATEAGAAPEQSPADAEPPPVRPEWITDLAAEVNDSTQAADSGIASDLARWAKAETEFLADVDARFAALRQETAERHPGASDRIAAGAAEGQRLIREFVSSKLRPGTGAAA